MVRINCSPPHTNVTVLHQFHPIVQKNLPFVGAIAS